LPGLCRADPRGRSWSALELLLPAMSEMNQAEQQGWNDSGRERKL
jgi:hypothetical protein